MVLASFKIGETSPWKTRMFQLASQILQRAVFDLRLGMLGPEPSGLQLHTQPL